MPMFLSRHERRDSADRDALGRAALNYCRYARSMEGVRSARFYWATADQVGIMVDAAPGAWGPGSALPPTPDFAKVTFALSDLAHAVWAEAWSEANTGEQAYRMR